MEMVYCTHCN